MKWMLMLLVLGGVAVGQKADGAFQDSLVVQGVERTYFVHVPPQYNGQPLPLLLVLHGGGGNGGKIARQTGFVAKANQEGFIVAFPNGQSVGANQHYWRSSSQAQILSQSKAALADQDVVFLGLVVSQIQKRLAVDSQRIYVTGFSNGGAMAHRLACERSDLFAAVAGVGGTLASPCQPSLPVSLLFMMGDEDPHFSQPRTVSLAGQEVGFMYGVEFWAQYNRCQPPITQSQGRVSIQRYTTCAANTQVAHVVLEGVGHNWPGGPEGRSDPIKATDAVWAFLQQFKKP